MDEGIIDVNTAMNYKAETAEGDRIRMFDEWTEFLADNQMGRFNVNGPALYLNTGEDNIAQARRGLAPTEAGNQVAGWSGYSYASPSAAASADPEKADAERSKLAEMLTSKDPAGEDPLFAEPAKVPELTWKTKPTTGNVAGSLVTSDGTPLDQVSVTLTNTTTGDEITGRVTDGSGWFGFVDVKPGKWKVTAELPVGVDGESSVVVKVKKGGLATADFTDFSQ